ncbi:uncharacterized protein LOC125200744 [Salvia hispanica]|uniref:uncharacterized protein LOC125200744 n=1 Tax=Salvia hispanica TaxID=49212 RepID=UPI002009A96B|nr:uncharacterized protein LOC125200744 [Salvia hispanica]
MIAIVRRNLSLLSNPNSFLCNSNAHSSPSIHFFSTRRIKRILIPSPEICDVLVNKHQFSPELASLASSRLPKFRDPQRADSVLSFLKENIFTTAQLQKLVIYDPRILGFTIERFESRFKVFQNLGLSSEEIAKMISHGPAIIHSSMENRINPRLSILKGLIGSNDDVARFLKRCPWLLVTDLERSLIPNVEIVKSTGIPMERVLHLVYASPRGFLIKPDIMRKSVDKAIEIGVPHNSVVFIYAVGVFNYTSQGMWEVKLETLRNLGFSDKDILKIFRTHPHVFSASGNKLKKKVELLLATGKYSVSNIAASPSALGCSVEKRIEPRMQILKLLESRNLIEKWPCLSAVLKPRDEEFMEKFVRPYYDEIGEELITQRSML